MYLKRFLKTRPLLFSTLLLIRTFYIDLIALVKELYSKWLLEVYHHQRFTWYANLILKIIEEEFIPSVLLENANKSYISGSGFNEAQKYSFLSHKKNEDLISSFIIKKEGVQVEFLDSSWVTSIGHTSLLSMFPKIEQCNLDDKRQKIIFYSLSANEAYLNLFSDYFSLIKLKPEKLRRLQREIRPILKNMGSIRIKDKRYTEYSAQNLIEHKYRELFGNSKTFFAKNIIYERVFDHGLINKFGLHPGKFVSFHVRNIPTHISRSGNNADLATYIKAIEYLVKIGIPVVILGHSQMPKIINLIQSNLIFDYAHSENKCDNLDLYFMSNAAFVVGTASGPINIPNDFGIPSLYTNLVHLGFNFDIRGYAIPHLFKNLDSGKYLSYSQMIKSQLAWTSRETDQNISRIRNTEFQILKGVQTMVNEFYENKHEKWIKNRMSQKFDGQRPTLTIEPHFYESNYDLFNS